MYHRDTNMMNATDALAQIQEATHRGRWQPDPHAKRRFVQRGVSIMDVKNALLKATACAAYSDPERPTPAGTSWRVSGPDFDGDVLNVGVDLVVDHLGGFAVVVTVF